MSSSSPKVSALSPVDPSTVTDAEKEEKAAWISRKLLGSITGRIALASWESVRSSGLSIVCLSPWGDASPLMLPCIRMRDVAIHMAVAATGGTAAMAAPFAGPFADAVVGTVGESLVVEAATAEVATDFLFDKTADFASPRHQKCVTTKSVKTLTATIKFHHLSITDASLGFFRASSVVHAEPSLFASVSEYISTEKGWFAPYLQASGRRPMIPRNFSPDVIYSHGPFVNGDYALGTRIGSELATLINLVCQSSSAPPLASSAPSTTVATPTSPRNMLLTVVGLAPHRFGMWTSSARPGESVIRYSLLDGCPGVLVPVLPGSPLLAWNTMTLERLQKDLKDQIGPDGVVKRDAKKVNAVVDALFEFVSLCIDWQPLRLPDHPEERESSQESMVRDGIFLLVEGAIKSGEVAAIKVVKKEVDIARAGIAMWRIP